MHSNIKAPKNGYAYVYISNQSNVDVFFDNLKVQVVTGNIIEENHYYAYGLKIAGISSKKLGDTYEGTLKNSYLYNDKELFEDGDLNWYDYGFRNYDPQIGRFTQLDPLTDEYPEFTPYQYASCDPITNIDIDGLEGGKAVLGVVSSSVGDAVVTAGSSMQNLIIVATKATVKAAAKSGGLLSGIGRFFTGAAQGIVETAKFAINVLNPDLSQNSLVQTGKFIVNTIKDPVGTARAIIETIKQTDYSDPATWGKIASSLITPGAALKVIKYVSKASKGAKVGNLGSKAKKILKDCGCFIAGTLVLTDAGYKKIEEIKKGDIVWAYNDTTGTYAKKKVLKVFEYVRDTVYKIQIGKETISATSDHPFFIGGRWLNVAELKVGDSVITYEGKKLVITSIEKLNRRTRVYNFEVEDYHTYYVSEQKILVHNSLGPCDNDLSKSVRNKHLSNDAHPKTKVPFDKDGFPDFQGHLYKGGPNDVTIKPTKNRLLDEDAANAAAGYKNGTPAEHTWHHHQQTGRMQLVETQIHRKTGHTGGYSIWGQ